MTMQFEPLKDRVFISYTEQEDRTPGGLYIPDNAKKKPQIGIVEAVGSEVKWCKVGDKVVYDKYSGSQFKMNEQEFLIIKEEDILGKIKEV
jgi:chaperonin GroES